ncbi:MAG: hypothetical protein H7A25_09435 [Leptospiraceae bacterium]|nr:hypothetical protein [Leptospiraceae bacterium]
MSLLAPCFSMGKEENRFNPSSGTQLLRFFSGKRRYIDVAGIDEETEAIVELHQIGKKNKNGEPVMREKRVLDEVEKEFGIRPEFHAYNEDDKQ